MTLTSAFGMIRSLQDAFRALKERIRRLTPLKLVEKGYLKASELKKYYPDKKPNERLRFEYLKVQTSEGVEGVMHILYFGDYIPQGWLSKAWRDITGTAYIVDIRACKETVNDEKRLARYCIAQYVSGQSGFVRFSWSWGWVAKGFVKVWKKLVELANNIKLAIELWERLLSGEEIEIQEFKFKPPPRLGFERIVIRQVSLC